MSDVPNPSAPPIVKRPWLWTLFALIILSIPAAATLAAKLRPHRTNLPHLGKVPAFSLIDQEGHPFDSSELAGKTWVVDFVFTSCPEACPKLSAEMARLQTWLQNRGKDAEIHLLSITVDPEHDTPERLKAYAAGFHADPHLWKFVTGSSKQIEDAVVGGFKISVTKEKDDTPTGFSILHGTHFILIDGAGAIRGFYDASDSLSMERLREHIQIVAGGNS